MLCLIVDDNPNNRMVAEFICEDLDIETKEMGSASEAIRYLDDGGAAGFILLDWMMPEMDGVDFIKTIREKGYNQTVVMCSAKDAHMFKTEALAAGAQAYIQKPITLTSLEKVLKETGLL